MGTLGIDDRKVSHEQRVRAELGGDPKTLDAVMRDHVWAVLHRCGNNKSLAAEKLGITRWKLLRMLRRWGFAA